MFFGATSYNLFRWESPGGPNSTTIPATTSPYTQTNLIDGITYHFGVAALNEGGTSLPSDQVSVTVRPSAPLNVSAIISNDIIIISWSDDVFGATNYNIYWSDSPGVIQSNETSMRQEILISPFFHAYKGVTNYYIVTAVNEGGESLPSNETSSITIDLISGFKFAMSTDSSKYYLSDNFNLSWTEANTLCNQAGGHMVTIGSQEENDLVLLIQDLDRLNPHVWIGFSDQVTEGNFVWVTGEPITYTNWFPGEPNDQSGEDYTIIHSTNHGNPGSWADQPNSVNRYPVICEIDQ